jgi:hypothetical protein
MPERLMLAVRRVRPWIIVWTAAGALYLLLIDITDLPELIVGAGAAAIAATAFELARGERIGGDIRPTLRWFARAHRPLLKVPSDVAALSLIALRQLIHPRPVNGEFRAVPFPCGDQEHEFGRRALAESLGSFAPNTIVVGVDVDRELILGHQLRPGGGREAIDVLGLGTG